MAVVRVVRLYALLFLHAAVPYGILIALMEAALGLFGGLEGVGRATVLYGLYGSAMSLLFGTAAIAFDPGGARRPGGWSAPRCEVISTSAEPARALRAARTALLARGAEVTLIGPGTFRARTPGSWGRSWGEDIDVRADGVGAGAELRISTAPVIRKTRVDLGSSQRVINGVAAAVRAA